MGFIWFYGIDSWVWYLKMMRKMLLWNPGHPPVENYHPSANPIDLTLRDILLDEASLQIMIFFGGVGQRFFHGSDEYLMKSWQES